MPITGTNPYSWTLTDPQGEEFIASWVSQGQWSAYIGIYGVIDVYSCLYVVSASSP